MVQIMGPDLAFWFERRVAEITQGAKDVIQDGALEIALEVVHNVETRGTPKSGKRGRIETGKMRDSATAEVTKDTNTEYEVRSGFRDAPFYTFFQERGTETIPAMYAVSDAYEAILPEIEERLSNL